MKHTLQVGSKIKLRTTYSSCYNNGRRTRGRNEIFVISGICPDGRVVEIADNDGNIVGVFADDCSLVSNLELLSMI